MGDLFAWSHLFLLAQIVIIYIAIPYLIYRSIKKFNYRLTEIEKTIKKIEKNQSSST